MFKKNLNYKIGTYGHLNSRLKDIKKVTHVDVLFLGSSHVYRGFDTRIFKEKGFNTFNLGSSAQTPIQTELLLKRYLDSLQPKVIIYDVYPEVFSSDGLESSLDIIANSKNDLASLNMALKLNHIKTYNTLGYGFFRDILNLNSDFKEPRIRNEDTYITNGFVEKKLTFYKGQYHHDINWEFKEKQLKAFYRIMDLIKSKNIDYYLVQVPVTTERYKGYNNKGIFEDFMNGQGRYFNFNDVLQLTDSIHFYDTQHLNSKGVEVFNNHIIETVLKK